MKNSDALQLFNLLCCRRIIFLCFRNLIYILSNSNIAYFIAQNLGYKYFVLRYHGEHSKTNNYWIPHFQCNKLLFPVLKCLYNSISIASNLCRTSVLSYFYTFQHLNNQVRNLSISIMAFTLINRIQKMTNPLSKLTVQLAREQPVTLRSHFNEQIIDDIYNTICKQQPKNLMLSQFMALIIDKDFVRNSHQLHYFAELYDSIRNSCLNSQSEEGKNALEGEDMRFSRKKFTYLLQQMAKKIFPGSLNPYQTVFFDRLTRTEGDDHRLKIDQGLRKLLNHEVIATISQYDRELKSVFEAYMPENYNLKLSFHWEQIKILQKKLPIICFLRFLNEAEVVPQFVQPAMFLELVSKLKPPSLPSSGSSKEAMFYTTDAINVYIRDHCSLPHIRLLDGDLGLTFLQLQILFIRVACDFAKDSKNQWALSIHRLAEFIKLKQAFQQGAVRKSRFMETIHTHSKLKGIKTEKIIVKKRQSHKQIEDLYDSKDIQMKDEALKNVYRNVNVDSRQIQLIKRDLDGQLGELPQPKRIQKENNGYFDVEKKHIVIGQQLPKIQEKNKPAAKADPKKKSDDGLMGYKPQTPKIVQESSIKKIVQKSRKLRTNTEFPIILNEVFYPSDLKTQLFIGPKAELYLEKSYIHLGERLYEQSFLNYTRAKSCTESKSSITQFYYNIHGAQIFQSAGRDDIALSFYHKAKELIGVLASVDHCVRAHPYIGMGVSLYHMEEYEYALRCFEKAKSVQGTGLEADSFGNAILQNNSGCCLMMLNRNQEAAKCFQRAHCILDLRIGCFDQRTLVTQQNLNKNRKAYLQMIPEFKTMWKTYQEKNTTKLPAVKSTAKPKR